MNFPSLFLSLFSAIYIICTVNSDDADSPQKGEPHYFLLQYYSPVRRSEFLTNKLAVKKSRGEFIYTQRGKNSAGGGGEL